MENIFFPNFILLTTCFVCLTEIEKAKPGIQTALETINLFNITCNIFISQCF